MTEPAQLIPANPLNDGLPSVAVVVIGRNEGLRLKRCLESVNQANYPAHLLDRVYVDSGSTDDSLQTAQQHGFRVLTFTGKPTAARARNAGWTSTDAPFVLFLDGDTILDPSFIERALPVMQDSLVAGVSGNRREINTQASLYNAISDLYWYSPPGPKAYFGGDAFVRLEALRSVNGYNPDLIAGEEPDMCRRMRGLGYKIQRIDVPMTLHDIDMHSFGQYWRRCVRSGYAYAEVSAKYATTSDPLWSAESRNNIVRASIWAVLIVVSFASAVALRTPLPLLVFLLFAALFTIRTAWSVRSRTGRWPVRLAYGFMSHLQHLPIMIGQIRFWLTRRKNGTAQLIEYK